VLQARYKQVVPGGHDAAKEPWTVTLRVLFVVLSAVNVNVPRTAVGDELVMTSSPDTAANISIVPAFV
jgi:hypothetical protein